MGHAQRERFFSLFLRDAFCNDKTFPKEFMNELWQCTTAGSNYCSVSAFYGFTLR